MPPRPRPYDKFMVSYKIGADPALRRIPGAQRWVWVAGVLALAAQSPIRGHLVIPGELAPVTAADLAAEAGVGGSVAKNALEYFRKASMVEPDETLPGFEFVPNFKLYNPDPAARSPEGERLRKRAQRARENIVASAVRGALV